MSEMLLHRDLPHDPAKCRKSVDGKHHPDPKTGREADGVEWIWDFTCINCGHGGSVHINPDDIQWG